MKKVIAVILAITLVCSLSGCCLSHNWMPATCAAPRMCENCGKTEGEMLPHTFKEATCTAPKTCTGCNLAEGEKLPHSWKDADCTTPRICVVCGAAEGEALGHNLGEWVTVSAATCTEEGIKISICAVCNAEFKDSITKPEHTPGDWKITKQATASEKGERTKNCTVCGFVIETEQFERSPEEIEQEYKAACQSYTYSEIARNPGAYEGKYAVFTGEVIQVQQDVMFGLVCYVLRVDVTKTGRYYNDTVYVTYYASEDEARILEDDIITMYGELKGEKTYKTVLGASVTIPYFSAEYIEIN